MEALRCKDCGDTRWSPMGFKTRTDARCEICGGEMIAERRHPNQGPLHLIAERRGVAGRAHSRAVTGPRSR